MALLERIIGEPETIIISQTGDSIRLITRQVDSNDPVPAMDTEYSGRESAINKLNWLRANVFASVVFVEGVALTSTILTTKFLYCGEFVSSAETLGASVLMVRLSIYLLRKMNILDSQQEAVKNMN